MDRHRSRRSEGSNANKGRRRKRCKKNRRSSFMVCPCAKIDWNNPARTAWVYWPGRGAPLLYRLDYLDSYELRNFWQMDYKSKAEYLRINFNRHHKRPRCQDGPTTPENLSYVDIFSHNTCYNGLISVVAYWCGKPVKKVFTADIERFLRKVYPHLKNLMSRKNSRKLKGFEAVIDQKNLKSVHRVLIVNIAKWAKVDSHSVHVSDVRRFLNYIYVPIKRLALDHESRRLRTLPELFRMLNEIWLPADDQIDLSKGR